MGKKKNFECSKILEALTEKQLAAISYIAADKNHFKDFVSILNQLVLTDKEKQVGLVSDISSVDKAVELTSKQNFYRGRINSIVLIHSLIRNASDELERRERKK